MVFWALFFPPAQSHVLGLQTGVLVSEETIPTVMSTCCRDATPSLVLSAFSCSRLGAAQRVVEICSGGLEPAPEIKSRQLWGGC